MQEDTGYDEVIETLEAVKDVDTAVLYLAVEVDQGQLELACDVIEGCGADVSSTNDHEAGHTIYFTV